MFNPFSESESDYSSDFSDDDYHWRGEFGFPGTLFTVHDGSSDDERTREPALKRQKKLLIEELQESGPVEYYSVEEEETASERDENESVPPVKLQTEPSVIDKKETDEEFRKKFLFFLPKVSAPTINWDPESLEYMFMKLSSGIILLNSDPDDLAAAKDISSVKAVLADQHLKAEVAGSNVTVVFNQKKSAVIHAECGCNPVFKAGSKWCRHILALLLHCIQHPQSIATLDDLQQRLKKLTKQQLEALILNQLFHDQSILPAVENTLTQIESGSECIDVSRKVVETKVLPFVPPETLFESCMSLETVDPESIRAEMSFAFSEWKKSKPYGYYDEMGNVVEKTTNALLNRSKQLWVKSEFADALVILRVVTEELVGWLMERPTGFDAHGMATSKYLDNVVDIWMEFMVSFPFGKDQAAVYAAKLSDWAHKFDCFSPAWHLAQHPWEEPHTKAILAGTAEPDENWKESKAVQKARILYLEQHGHIQEMLNYSRYANMDSGIVRALALLGKTREAVSTALTKNCSAEELLSFVNLVQCDSPFGAFEISMLAWDRLFGGPRDVAEEAKTRQINLARFAIHHSTSGIYYRENKSERIDSLVRIAARKSAEIVSSMEPVDRFELLDDMAQELQCLIMMELTAKFCIARLPGPELLICAKLFSTMGEDRLAFTVGLECLTPRQSKYREERHQTHLWLVDLACQFEEDKFANLLARAFFKITKTDDVVSVKDLFDLALTFFQRGKTYAALETALCALTARVQKTPAYVFFAGRRTRKRDVLMWILENTMIEPTVGLTHIVEVLGATCNSSNVLMTMVRYLAESNHSDLLPTLLDRCIKLKKGRGQEYFQTAKILARVCPQDALQLGIKAYGLQGYTRPELHDWIFEFVGQLSDEVLQKAVTKDMQNVFGHRNLAFEMAKYILNRGLKKTAFDVGMCSFNLRRPYRLVDRYLAWNNAHNEEQVVELGEIAFWLLILAFDMGETEKIDDLIKTSLEGSDPKIAFALAKAAKEKSKDDIAFQLADRSLLLSPNPEVAAWVCDLATALGKKDKAKEAGIILCKHQPSVENFLKLKTLNVSKAESMELLSELESSTKPGSLDILLHEQMWDRALIFVEKNGNHPDLFLRLMKAAEESNAGILSTYIERLENYIFKQYYKTNFADDKVEADLYEAIKRYTPQLAKTFEKLRAVCAMVYSLPSQSTHYVKLVSALQNLKRKFLKHNKSIAWIEFISHIQSLHKRKVKLLEMMSGLTSEDMTS